MKTRAHAVSVLAAVVLGVTAALGGGCASAGGRGRAIDAATERASAADVSAVLDALHGAAASADEDVYFDLFTPEAIFLGTDGTERWTMAEFRAFAEPYFQRESAWVYRVLDRHVTLDPGGAVAWFDERLWNDRLGETRGSGVLRRVGGAWKIEQYNLTMLIPNERADEVARLVREGSR